MVWMSLGRLSRWQLDTKQLCSHVEAMAIRTILHYPNKLLREKAQPVQEITPEIQQLIDDMAETMYAAPGCGLAAPQIGESVRLFVIDIATGDEPSQLTVFINPEIVEKVGEITWEEGCLSFPTLHEDIKRAEKVRVRAQNREGKTFEMEADGLFAVAIQHENDHLDGVLMIDHLGALRKRMAQRKMQKRAAHSESRA
jgi:peptide deformylase